MLKEGVRLPIGTGAESKTPSEMKVHLTKDMLVVETGSVQSDAILKVSKLSADTESQYPEVYEIDPKPVKAKKPELENFNKMNKYKGDMNLDTMDKLAEGVKKIKDKHTKTEL